MPLITAAPDAGTATGPETWIAEFPVRYLPPKPPVLPVPPAPPVTPVLPESTSLPVTPREPLPLSRVRRCWQRSRL